VETVFTIKHLKIKFRKGFERAKQKTSEGGQEENCDIPSHGKR
jgi:hypothetical protein